MAAKNWCSSVSPARSTVSDPIRPVANVPVLESPYKSETGICVELNVDCGYNLMLALQPSVQASEMTHRSDEPLSEWK